MRRFAKSVKGSNPSAGSNPVLSASSQNVRRKLLLVNFLRRTFFICPSHWDKYWDKTLRMSGLPISRIRSQQSRRCRFLKCLNSR